MEVLHSQWASHSVSSIVARKHDAVHLVGVQLVPVVLRAFVVTGRALTFDSLSLEDWDELIRKLSGISKDSSENQLVIGAVNK